MQRETAFHFPEECVGSATALFSSINVIDGDDNDDDDNNDDECGDSYSILNLTASIKSSDSMSSPRGKIYLPRGRKAIMWRVSESC